MKPPKEEFYRLYKSEYDFYSPTRTPIYQCEDDNPPSRLSATVTTLCDIKYSFNTPYDSLEDFIGANGKKLKELRYEIEMIPSGASNEFSIYHQGKKLGSQRAQIDFQ